jgi:hypothetical protein
MKWVHCPQKYVGQIGRNFHTGYKEHTQAIRKKIAVRVVGKGRPARKADNLTTICAPTV